jgi:hypothetical protein
MGKDVPAWWWVVAMKERKEKGRDGEGKKGMKRGVSTVLKNLFWGVEAVPTSKQPVPTSNQPATNQQPTSNQPATNQQPTSTTQVALPLEP